VTVEVEVIARVVRHLDALGIPYMITGSVASARKEPVVKAMLKP
jgi:hypothetical protein